MATLARPPSGAQSLRAMTASSKAVRGSTAGAKAASWGSTSPKGGSGMPAARSSACRVRKRAMRSSIRGWAWPENGFWVMADSPVCDGYSLFNREMRQPLKPALGKRRAKSEQLRAKRCARRSIANLFFALCSLLFALRSLLSALRSPLFALRSLFIRLLVLRLGSGGRAGRDRGGDERLVFLQPVLPVLASRVVREVAEDAFLRQNAQDGGDCGPTLGGLVGFVRLDQGLDLGVGQRGRVMELDGPGQTVGGLDANGRRASRVERQVGQILLRRLAGQHAHRLDCCRGQVIGSHRRPQRVGSGADIVTGEFANRHFSQRLHGPALLVLPLRGAQRPRGRVGDE